MPQKIQVLNGISKRVREAVGMDAQNRGDDEPTDGDESDEDDEDSDERPNAACSSAAGNTDLTVLDR